MDLTLSDDKPTPPAKAAKLSAGGEPAPAAVKGALASELTGWCAQGLPGRQLQGLRQLRHAREPARCAMSLVCTVQLLCTQAAQVLLQVQQEPLQSLSAFPDYQRQAEPQRRSQWEDDDENMLPSPTRRWPLCLATCQLVVLRGDVHELESVLLHCWTLVAVTFIYELHTLQ